MRKIKLPAVDKLQAAVARDFRGGLNTFDSPLNLNSKYLTDVRNLYPDSNGKLSVRYGTSPFADVEEDQATTAAIDEIIGMEYYAGALVVVGANGKIVTVDASGVVNLRWSTAIAALLPGAPAGWTNPITYTSFTQFAGQLIICNGVDKPVTMDELYAVTYVQDPVSGTNTNTPRAKYCTTHDGHLVLAVTPTDTYTVYVSGQGVTSFDPDASTNGANMDTSIYIDRGVPVITGLATYRDRLVVTYQEAILAIQFILPTSAPVEFDVTDIVSGYGAVSHKAITVIGDDMLVLDTSGVISIKRTALGTDFIPEPASSLINTDVQRALARFSNTQLTEHVFSVHDRIAHQIQFFIPVIDTVTATTQNDVFVYCYDKSQRFKAWTRYDAMPYRAACRTTEGRIFYGAGTSVRYYHNAYEPRYTDAGAIGQQNWDDGDAWDDGTGWEEGTADLPINFYMNMPWADFKQPLNNKMSKYVSTFSEGTGSYTVDMYIDEFTTPSLSMFFMQESGPHAASYEHRPPNNEQLYAWPQKFMRMRFRISGSTSSAFSIIAVGILYLTGSVRR
jgi:hypothetical protein